MLSIIAFLGVVLSSAYAHYPPDSSATASTFAEHSKDVEIFAAAFYSSMVVKFGFNNVAGIEVPGSDAEQSEYNVALAALQKKGLSDAKEISKEVSRPLGTLDTVPLAVYFEKTAHEVGAFLDHNGLMDSSNAITLSFELFKVISKNVGGDQSKFESYVEGVIHGLIAFVGEKGLPPAPSVKQLTYLFCKEFDSVDQGSCKYGQYDN